MITCLRSLSSLSGRFSIVARYHSTQAVGKYLILSFHPITSIPFICWDLWTSNISVWISIILSDRSLLLCLRCSAWPAEVIVHSYILNLIIDIDCSRYVLARFLTHCNFMCIHLTMSLIAMQCDTLNTYI
jgi:hypothetical protein